MSNPNANNPTTAPHEVRAARSWDERRLELLEKVKALQAAGPIVALALSGGGAPDGGAKITFQGVVFVSREDLEEIRSVLADAE